MMTESQLRRQTVDYFYRWVGITEVNGKHRMIIDIYNSITPLPQNQKLKYTDPWCAATVSAIAQKVGLTQYIFPECSCNRMIALYQKNGRWEERDDYNPQIGDLCFYDWDDNGVGDCVGSTVHVGMVCDITGNTFKVLEGNYSKEVKCRTMEVNGKYIRGFGLPDYKKAASSGYVQPVDKTKIKTIAGQVPYLQINDNNEAVLIAKVVFKSIGFNVDTTNIFDEQFENVVKQYQKMYNLRQNGIISRDVWQLLLQGKPRK